MAGLLRAAGCVEVDHAELAPEHARAFRDRVLDDLRHELRAAKYVHHLDRLGNRRQVGVAFLAQSVAQRVGFELRIDRDHLETAAFEQFCDSKRVARRIVGASDDCDRGRLRQNRANLGVGRIVEFGRHLTQG